MVFEGDFVAGEISGSTRSELGVDADVFPFPEIEHGRRLVMGGGDVAVLLARSEAAEALVRFLATPEAGEVWARLGGFVSPNEDVDLRSYPDETSRDIARAVLEAGDGFRFDLSDLQPAEFGATQGRGMYRILGDFLVDPRHPAATAARLERAARAAGVNGG